MSAVLDSPAATLLRKPPTLDPPHQFKRALERARIRDRRFFRKHPRAMRYVREIVVGEDWPFLLPAGTKVVVHRVLGASVRFKEFRQ